MKIAIDVKKGVEVDKLMQKLYKQTPLEDTFSCNFNILVKGYPKVLGVYDIIKEWVSFRMGCVKRRTAFDMKKKQEKLHLLKGLGKILLDIDKAIKIVRETKEESDVVPNLMVGFGIDEIQAEYVAEIKLRHLNREYILKRTEETKALEDEIMRLEELLGSDRKIKQVIIKELEEVKKKYAQPRKTGYYYPSDVVEIDEQEEIPDYPCEIFLSSEGYFKKCTPQSLRMASEQKLKEGDFISQHAETTNKSELIFFSDKCSVYKAKLSQFADSKASAMGDYIPAKLAFEKDENVVYAVNTTDYTGYMIFVFENGKVAKVPLDSYETKTNRKKLANAYSGKAKLVKMFWIKDNVNIMLRTTNGRAMIFDTSLLMPKASRETIGVQAMICKARSTVEKAFILTDEKTAELSKYRSKTISVAGSFAKEIEDPDQMSLI